MTSADEHPQHVPGVDQDAERWLSALAGTTGRDSDKLASVLRAILLARQRQFDACLNELAHAGLRARVLRAVEESRHARRRSVAKPWLAAAAAALLALPIGIQIGHRDGDSASLHSSYIVLSRGELPAYRGDRQVQRLVVPNPQAVAADLVAALMASGAPFELRFDAAMQHWVLMAQADAFSVRALTGELEALGLKVEPDGYLRVEIGTQSAHP